MVTLCLYFKCVYSFSALHDPQGRAGTKKDSDIYQWL